MNYDYLLKHLHAEYSRITLENLISAGELSDTDVSYDEGWANGFAYAVEIVKEHINKSEGVAND